MTATTISGYPLDCLVDKKRRNGFSKHGLIVQMQFWFNHEPWRIFINPFSPSEIVSRPQNLFVKKRTNFVNGKRL